MLWRAKPLGLITRDTEHIACILWYKKTPQSALNKGQSIEVYFNVDRVSLRLYQGFNGEDPSKWDGDVPALGFKTWSLQPCFSPREITARKAISIQHHAPLPSLHSACLLLCSRA